MSRPVDGAIGTVTAALPGCSAVVMHSALAAPLATASARPTYVADDGQWVRWIVSAIG